VQNGKIDPFQQMDVRTVLVPVALLTVAIGLTAYNNFRRKNVYERPELFELGMNTPTIWIYIDDTHVNSRQWADFGGRSSRVYNLPFLNLCYQTIVKAATNKYHVEVISGLADAERRLGYLPRPMQNKKLPLRDEEYTYLKVAFLQKYGGLWISPATIFIAPLPSLPDDKIVLFGSDPLETYAGPDGTFIPNQHAMWSPKPNMQFFNTWKIILEGRISRQAGGTEIRNDKNWDILFVGTGQREVVVMPNGELTRKKNGRKIELEDLLASGTGGDLPFDVPAQTIYVPFPMPELLERRIFGWFLRLSEEQVMDSDLAVSWLFKKGL
jgi:hypothetical protein